MFSLESLLLPAFIAGIITFLAPCTLPLVPGFIGFISGSSINKTDSTNDSRLIRRRVIINAALYVLGFSVVFVVLGILFGMLGSVLAPYRVWLARIGGLFILFFGLYLTGIFHTRWFQFLNKQKRFSFVQKLTPGRPLSSLIFGMTFAFGWTPCIGPILGSVLLVASTQGTVLAGAVLLSVFTLGLAIPYMILAFFIGHATTFVSKMTQKMHVISFVGGLLLIVLGILVVLDRNDVFIGFFYQLLSFIDYESTLLDFL
ncbi:MAG: cytochrome c biogenesis CcdA family protein [Patescibacteria group bacterium]